MATSFLYENDRDRMHHFRTIQRLAEDLQIPVAEIQILYETVLFNLIEKARVKDYLAILVSRNVKAMLKGDNSSWTL